MAVKKSANSATQVVKTVDTAVKEEVKKAAETEIKAAPKAPVKKETVAKKAPVKKEAAPKAAGKKETAPKATVKKETASKKETAVIAVQFGSKSYTQDDFVRMAKDVWVFDLARKAEDFKNVEIYVKPEENMAYFVVNGEESGSFLI